MKTYKVVAEKESGKKVDVALGCKTKEEAVECQDYYMDNFDCKTTWIEIE